MFSIDQSLLPFRSFLAQETYPEVPLLKKPHRKIRRLPSLRNADSESHQQAEFAKTFNTGLGMVMVVGKDELDSALRELQSAGETVWQVGTLIERTNEGCVIENMGTWT